MKKYIILFSLLFSSTTFGFESVKDGEYVGEITCITNELETFRDSAKVRFSANQLHWSSSGDSGPINHTHTFILKKDGFFELLDNGNGYSTARGLHFETDVQGIKTEETYTVSGYDLIYQSSLSLRNMKIKCSAKFMRNFIL